MGDKDKKEKVTLEGLLKEAKENDCKVLLVEANFKKGFNYSYLLFIPNTPLDMIMMDCLNDYEKKCQREKLRI